MKGTSPMRVAHKSWRMWGAVAVLLAASGPARAFYWYGWPGSQLRVEPTLVPPQVTAQHPPPSQPPAQPPEFPQPPPPIRTPTPPIGPSVPVDNPPLGPPEHTPEPSTGLIGLIGLGALAARRWRKGK